MILLYLFFSYQSPCVDDYPPDFKSFQYRFKPSLDTLHYAAALLVQHQIGQRQTASRMMNLLNTDRTHLEEVGTIQRKVA